MKRLGASVPGWPRAGALKRGLSRMIGGFLRGGRAALGKVPDFVGHDREAHSSFPRPGRLDGGIEVWNAISSMVLIALNVEGRLHARRVRRFTIGFGCGECTQKRCPNRRGQRLAL